MIVKRLAYKIIEMEKRVCLSLIGVIERTLIRSLNKSLGGNRSRKSGNVSIDSTVERYNRALEEKRTRR